MSKVNTKKSAEKAMSAVEAAFEAQLDLLNMFYPKQTDGSSDWARKRYAGDLVWKAEADLNKECTPAKDGKIWGAYQNFMDATRDHEDAVFLAQARGEDTEDANRVYDTRVERAEQRLAQATAQYDGAVLRVDVAHMLADYVADKG